MYDPSDVGEDRRDVPGGRLEQRILFCLLQAQLRTRATGTSRAATAMIKVKRVLLGIATLWSLLHAITPSMGWLAFIDPFWPLSMLGMFVIGIRIAVAGRWRGALRVWPIIAETWAIVTVPTMALFGADAARWVGGAHLLIGYCVLGLLVTRLGTRR